MTFAHEYDHALQDANFDVFQDPEALRDQSDEALARAALYEGDATLLMSQWLVPNLTPEEIQEVLAAGSDPESTAVLERDPAGPDRELLFPYNAGTRLASRAPAGGRLGRGRRALRPPAGLDRAGHPSREVRGDEAPDRR